MCIEHIQQIVEILMDRECECLWENVLDNHINLNICSKSKHIREIEQQSWIVKEGASGIYNNTLHFANMPRELITKMVYTVVFWLNTFHRTLGAPTSDGNFVLAGFFPLSERNYLEPSNTNITLLSRFLRYSFCQKSLRDHYFKSKYILYLHLISIYLSLYISIYLYLTLTFTRAFFIFSFIFFAQSTHCKQQNPITFNDIKFYFQNDVFSLKLLFISQKY